MISVIIPLMRVEPYATQITVCLNSLNNQTANIEILLKEHGTQNYIEKTKLLNEGIRDSKGDIVWFCDADFILPDPELLARMEVKLKKDGLDVIFPMFSSEVYKGNKIAEGAPFIRKDVLAEFGELDESLIGIGGVYFSLLDWCLDNTKFHCSNEFFIELNTLPFKKLWGKAPRETLERTKDIRVKIKKKLIERELWPSK